MQLGLSGKCMLATVSGVACWWVAFFSHIGDSETILSALGFCVLSGLLFALGVLFPYLRRGRSMMWRGAALVAVSALSYWCALIVINELKSPWGVPNVEDFIPASLVGALIVLLGAKLVIPLNHLGQIAISGLVAAVLGGLAFSAPPLWGTAEDSFILAYGAWHLLMAAAIHFGALRDWRAQ